MTDLFQHISARRRVLFAIRGITVFLCLALLVFALR
jgi:hypothetical protein